VFIVRGALKLVGVHGWSIGAVGEAAESAVVEGEYEREQGDTRSVDRHGEDIVWFWLEDGCGCQWYLVNLI
jgi:hypothetical protein